MATTNFVNNTTLSEAAWFNDVDATIYEQHGVGKTTVASATTPDIFAATVGHFIDYTGTATCTGFAAAVSAGSHRTLYCAGACLFTAGANLLIEGIPSGTTITLAAGAIVKVYAITTTQFKMTYSVSGTFTGTAVGLTTSPTATVKFVVINGVAHLSIPSAALAGTSNATSFSMSGLPACVVPVTEKYLPFSFGIDNLTSVQIYGLIDAGGTSLKFGMNFSLTGFTSSGSKSIRATEFIYCLN